MATAAEIRYQRQNTIKMVTHIPPALKDLVDTRRQATGVPVSEILRRCLVLWVRGELDELLPHAGQ